MKAKHLESALSGVADFEQPKWALEQYRTPPRLAAAVLKCIEDELDGARVLDLGCGTGMLLAGACMLGAEEGGSVGVDADVEALGQAARNLLELGLEPELVLGDVVAGLPFASRRGAAAGPAFDVAVMNPPFGTKNQGVDLLFVKRGLEVRFGVWGVGGLRLYVWGVMVLNRLSDNDSPHPLTINHHPYPNTTQPPNKNNNNDSTPPSSTPCTKPPPATSSSAPAPPPACRGQQRGGDTADTAARRTRQREAGEGE